MTIFGKQCSENMEAPSIEWSLSLCIPPKRGNNMKMNQTLIDVSLITRKSEPAFKKVKRNKGAAGVDAKDIVATTPIFTRAWT